MHGPWARALPDGKFDYEKEGLEVPRLAQDIARRAIVRVSRYGVARAACSRTGRESCSQTEWNDDRGRGRERGEQRRLAFPTGRRLVRRSGSRVYTDGSRSGEAAEVEVECSIDVLSNG